MTNDSRPSATESDPPAASSTTSEEGGCGLEVVGVGLIGFGALISIAIPVVIFVGWIPVVIGVLMLRHAKRRNANNAEQG